MEIVKWPFLKQDWGIEFESSKGAYLYTKDGRKVLDAAGGAIVSNIGYGREEVADAIARAVKNNSYILPPFLTPEREALLDELREHWLPPHLSRIHLSSGGSEANESAVKLAIQYQNSRGKPEKNIILTRSLSYHGTTLNMSGISGHQARKRGLESYVPEPITIETPYPLRCPLGKYHPDAKDYYLDDLKKTIDRIGANNIAALLMEPINGSSGGAISPPDGYWIEAQEILRANDILLIADEVMTGFRLGLGGAQEALKVNADIVTFGKVIGGGLPVGAFAARKEVMDFLSPNGPVYQAGTLSGNPLAMMAGYTTLSILNREPSIYQSLADKTEYLHNGYNEVLKEKGIPNVINRYGSMISLHFTDNEVEDFETSSNGDNELFKKYFHGMLDEGIYLPPSAFESYFLNDSISYQDLDDTAQIFRDFLISL